MDDKGVGRGEGAQPNQGSYQGYATPGEETIIESESEAVHSPTKTAEQRLDAPRPIIQSIGETPGDANPALAETLNAQHTHPGSTAEMLMAREEAEERRLRSRGAATNDAAYQDQQRGVVSQEYLDSDSGRPNWPDDRQREPADYMESPRADMPLGTGQGALLDLTLKGRADAAMDRGSTEASAEESRSNLPPLGHGPSTDTYERREMDRPTPPSDMDLIAPEMSNLPPGDDDDR